jgi:hypothetical protein
LRITDVDSSKCKRLHDTGMVPGNEERKFYFTIAATDDIRHLSFFLQASGNLIRNVIKTMCNLHMGSNALRSLMEMTAKDMLD